ncbi:probable G-protein coupled receptor 139 [Scyliorhinus torazame]|uniref:probable G-protein coupled receptor 139 n=1 Tax=Scyliorhinus torazame TaxID=75743 RepID=UPI003B5CC12F
MEGDSDLEIMRTETHLVPRTVIIVFEAKCDMEKSEEAIDNDQKEGMVPLTSSFTQIMKVLVAESFNYAVLISEYPRLSAAGGDGSIHTKMRDIFGIIDQIYYVILATIGVPVNLLAIVILSRGKCGLCTCTTRYLVAMATADLLVIVTEVIFYQINYYYFPRNLLDITPVCSVTIVLTSAATDCSVWFTVTFSMDRFVAICCQKLKRKYCTKKTSAVILSTTCFLFCVKSIPLYFIYEPGKIVDNVPWFCAVKPSYYTEPGWVMFDWLLIVLTPLLPFALILLLNSLTVRHIIVASRVRKGLRGEIKSENHCDPEMESRRKSMILLFTISGSFILLWLLYVIEFLYYNITGIDPQDYSDSEYIFQQAGYMLQNLSCCTNTFIYGATQSKFREQVKSVVKYPVTSIIQLINKHNG